MTRLRGIVSPKHGAAPTTRYNAFAPQIAMSLITVILPAHLKTLARITGDLRLDVPAPVTVRSVLDSLEARFPMLRGTIRDHVTLERRPFLRFFACNEDLTHESPDAPLPAAVVSGTEPLFIIGAIAGG
jgi:sulfur-carrier protein